MTMPSTTIFDSMAKNYDAEFARSRIGSAQRKIVWSFLTPLLNKAVRPLKILEINCGTGEDALELAALGHTVIATDASTAMIQTAAAKLNGRSLDLQFVVSSFSQLSTLFSNEKFDLIFSNFGGLNCIDEAALTQLTKDLSVLTKPGGNIFLVLLAPFCLWEVFYFGIRGKFRKAFRRIKNQANFTVNDQTMPVYYHSPARIKKIFDPFFNGFKKQPVGLFIPPSYLENKISDKRLEKLDRLEKKFSSPIFSSFADHYCVIGNKTEPPR